MTIRLTREHSNPNTTQVVAHVDGPSTAELTEDETRAVVQALVTSHLLAGGENPDSRRQHTIERVLLRMGMELEGLDALHRY
jgi:hypothetical protein